MLAVQPGAAEVCLSVSLTTPCCHCEHARMLQHLWRAESWRPVLQADNRGTLRIRVPCQVVHQDLH